MDETYICVVCDKEVRKDAKEDHQNDDEHQKCLQHHFITVVEGITKLLEQTDHSQSYITSWLESLKS